MFRQPLLPYGSLATRRIEISLLKKGDPIYAWTNRNAQRSKQAIEFDPCCSDQTHSDWSCTDPRNVDTERRHTLAVHRISCQFGPLRSADAQLR